MSARRVSVGKAGVALGVVSALLAAGCSTATTGNAAAGGEDGTAGVTESEITLGMSNALSGPVAAVCLPASEGAKAWLAKVNDEGGVNGRTVKLTVLDDGYQAPRAAANVRELTGQGIFALLGGCGTVSAAAIATAVKGTDIPYLFPYAALPDLVEPTQPNIFSLLPLYHDQILTGIAHVAGTSPGSVYAVTSQIPGYESTVEGAKSGTKAADSTFIASALLPAANAHAAQEAAKAGDKGMDYLAMTVLAPDAARMLNAMADAGQLPEKAIIGAAPLAAQSFGAALAPSAAELLVALSPTVPPGDPAAKECVAALAEYSPDTDPDALALFGCAGAQVFVAALEEAGDSPTRSKLIAALESMHDSSVSPLLPPLTFDAEDHMGPNSMFLLGLDSAQQYSVTDTVPLQTAS